MIHRSNVRPALTAVLGGLLVACAGVSTSTVYRDRSFDFTRLETFEVRPLRTSGELTAFNARRIEAAVRRALTVKGLRSVDEESVAEDPDFAVVLDTEFRVGLNQRTVDRYTVVILVVDVIDTRNDRLVWRGKTEVELKRRLPDEADERLRNILRGLLGDFPAGTAN